MNVFEPVQPEAFDPSAKKRPKKSIFSLDSGDAALMNFGEKRVTKSGSSDANGARTKSNSERYEVLLKRIFDIMAQNNTDHGTRSERIFIKPPNITREGKKKTIWANFTEICTQLNRPTSHFCEFLFSELGTTGSIDKNGYLVIRGVFQSKNIESLIRRYIKDYVVCTSCRSLNTVMTKEDRLNFLDCNDCHSRRTVSAIKRGFQAQVHKRKKGGEE